jgi:hypothetical protein
MRGLSVIDPACACSCHEHLTEDKPRDLQLDHLVRLLATPTDDARDRTTVFQRAAIAFDLGEL